MDTEHMPQLTEADSAKPDSKMKECCTREKAPKWVLLSLLIGIIIYVIVDFVFIGDVNGVLVDFLEWVEDNPVEGLFAFAGVYLVATVCFVPGSLLTLGAGFVFGMAFGTLLGVVLGTLSVFIGAALGATAAFILGRYVLQEQAQQLAEKYKILRAIDRAVEKQGLRIIMLLRLSPLIPFNALNYLIALTHLSFTEYVLGHIALIPGTAAFVFIGSSAGSLTGGGGSSQEAQTVNLIVFVVGGIASFAAVTLISIYARRALRAALEEAERAETTNSGDMELGDGRQAAAAGGGVAPAR